MSLVNGPSSILYLSAGLEIEGGIASYSRCVAQALDEATRDGRVKRVDRVLLHDAKKPAPPASGQQRLTGGRRWLFALRAWRAFRRHAHDLVLLDHIGLGRALQLPLPGFPPAGWTTFVYGRELDAGGRGAQGRARVLRGANSILSISEFTRDRLVGLFPDVEGRVQIVRPCIEPRKLARWEAEPPGEAADREAAVLIVSRIDTTERGKGHDALIEAWPAVRERVPAAELWIVGGGDDGDRLRRKADSLGPTGIRLLGWVSDKELGRLYRRASVFAMPSRQEGFGLVYAEAMWHELPCVGSTADAAGELILDGQTGRLVPYGTPERLSETLVSLLSKPEVARVLGENGRRRVITEFSYESFRRALYAALGLDASRAQ